MNGNMLLEGTLGQRFVPLLAQAFDRPEADGVTGGWSPWYLVGVAVVVVAAFVVVIVLISYGKLWVQAVMSNAHVSLLSLIGMSLRQVHARTIVEAKIMANQAAVGGDPETGITKRSQVAICTAVGWLWRSSRRFASDSAAPALSR